MSRDSEDEEYDSGYTDPSASDDDEDWMPDMMESGSDSDDAAAAADGEEQDDVDAMHVSPDHGFTLTRSAKAHADDVNCVAWHPTNPNMLASCADDGSVKIWNVAVTL